MKNNRAFLSETHLDWPLLLGILAVSVFSF